MFGSGDFRALLLFAWLIWMAVVLHGRRREHGAEKLY
jgi:hypothetical protein